MWYGYGVILAVGLLAGLYYFWRMGRDEHWEEIAIFDAFFLSLLAYLFVGRIAFVGLHQVELNTFGKALAMLALPGINVFAGILGAVTIFLLIARVKEWELWKAADLLAVCLSLVLAFGALASLVVTSEQRLAAFASLILAILGFATTLRVKKNFRFYQWYKGEESVARDGLAALLGVLMAGGYMLISLLWHLLDYVRLGSGIVMVVLSIYIIISRRGRKKARANVVS